MSDFTSGFVAVVGRPNVGKSTLMNHVLGQKVAIVSDKPQTTRNQIQCILTTERSQVVFIDTPGIHKPHHMLGKYMVKAALATWSQVDCILFMVDGAAGIGGGDRFIAERLARVDTPVLLAMNKVDLMEKEAVLQQLSIASELGKYHSIYPISATTGDNVDKLLADIISLLPPGPKYYPDDMVSDHPEQFVVAELVREQILHYTSQEVPHSVAVQVEKMEYREDKDILDINIVILVERQSQKGIIIGKGGSMLKQIGSAARLEIEALLGSQVFLQLHVKVQEDWRQRTSLLRQLGYGE